MLDTTNLLKVGNFDPITIAQLADALGAGILPVSAAGNLAITTGYTIELSVSGTVAWTLPAPTVAGQRTRLVCVAATSTPLGTVTVTSPDATAGLVCPSSFVFTAVGQEVQLVATSALTWRVALVKRAGTQTLVIGTTLTAGLQLAALYACSVTGTVSSTTTRALPNGNYPGDQCQVGCSVAASIPNGTLGFTGLTTAGAALTSIAAIDATTDNAAFTWNGTAWQVITSSGLTIS